MVGGATVGRGAIVGGATVGRGAIGVCADGNTVADEHLPSKGLMNLLFLKVMRPEPFILILYCLFGSTSTILPVRSHRFPHCTRTLS